MVAMLVSSRGCARDPPHHQRVAGAPRHPRLETEPKCQPHSSETSVRKSTTKSTNKVKNTLKQIICRCFYLTHIFEVSRFFWTFFFQNLQICMWWGVGRSDFGPTFFVKVQLSIEWCAFCMLEKVEPDTCTWCSVCLSLDFHVTPAGWWHFERDVNTFVAEKCRVFTPEKPLFPRIK